MGVYLIIHKNEGDNRASRIHPILIFGIEACLHDKYLGVFLIEQAEEL